MFTLVRAKFRFVTKSHIAYAASIWFRVSVNQVMLFEIRRIYESFETKFTLRFSLQQMGNVDVSLQILLAHVFLVTVLVHAAKDLDFEFHFYKVLFWIVKKRYAGKY
jgi:hypothetical protein